MGDAARTILKRLCLYGLWLVVTVAIFWGPATALLRYSLENDNASHIVLIPLISSWLLYVERKKVFSEIGNDFKLAGVLLALTIGISLLATHSVARWSTSGVLGSYALALVCAWSAGFALLFGRSAVKNGSFSLLFLVLMVPLPDSLLNYVVYCLQEGSADITEMIFNLAGVPALREGFVFHLAHLSIEIAQECSGIRSSMALLILALLVGHLFLKTVWKQALFVVVGLVIMIVKNGIRIATLTILAQFVDPGFLYGRLHHEGGVVFFLIGLLLLFPVFWLLQRSERPAGTLASTQAA